MADAALDALYQEVILDHNRRPRNFHPMEHATCSADGKNPNCGDQLTVWLRVEDEKVADDSFQGVGCAISKASASLMTQAIKGKTREEATRLFEGFHNLVTQRSPEATLDKSLGSLRAFAGVAQSRGDAGQLASAGLRDVLGDREGDGTLDRSARPLAARGLARHGSRLGPAP